MSTSERDSLPQRQSSSRRDFLKAPLAAGAAGALLYAGYSGDSDSSEANSANERFKKAIDEHDPGNIKLATRLSDRIADNELLFFKQIGMRWARVSFNPETSSLD